MPNDKSEFLAKVPKTAEPQNRVDPITIKQARLGPSLAVIEASPDQPHLTFNQTGTKLELKTWWDWYCSNYHLLHTIRDKGDAVIDGGWSSSPAQLQFTGRGQYRSADTWKFEIQTVQEAEKSTAEEE